MKREQTDRKEKHQTWTMKSKDSLHHIYYPWSWFITSYQSSWSIFIMLFACVCGWYWFGLMFVDEKVLFGWLIGINDTLACDLLTWVLVIEMDPKPTIIIPVLELWRTNGFPLPTARLIARLHLVGLEFVLEKCCSCVLARNAPTHLHIPL